MTDKTIIVTLERELYKNMIRECSEEEVTISEFITKLVQEKLEERCK